MILQNGTSISEYPVWFIPIDVLHITFYVITVTLSILFLSIIALEQLYNRVAIVLVLNSCLAEFLFSSCLLGMAIFRFNNDVKQSHYYDGFCIFLAYLGYVSVVMQNYSYLLQAIYRYILIVHPNKLFYQSMKFQMSIIIITGICCIIYPIPLAFTGQIKYITDDGICQMPLELSFITIFNAIFVYFIPMPGIIIIYLKVVRYVHEMSKHVTPVNKLLRAQRNLRIIRHIVSLVFILVSLGFPYALFIFMSFFNSAPKYHFRIAFTFISASLVLVMITLLQMTEPLKSSLTRRLAFPKIHDIRMAR